MDDRGRWLGHALELEIHWIDTAGAYTLARRTVGAEEQGRRKRRSWRLLSIEVALDCLYGPFNHRLLMYALRLPPRGQLV